MPRPPAYLRQDLLRNRRTGSKEECGTTGVRTAPHDGRKTPNGRRSDRGHRPSLPSRQQPVLSFRTGPSVTPARSRPDRARDKPTVPYRPEKKIPSPGSSARRRICDRQHAKGLRHDGVAYTACRTIRPQPRTEACSPSAIRFEKGFRRHVLRRMIQRLDRRRPCACKRIANPSDGASARQTAGSSTPKGKRAQARPPEDLLRLKRRRNRIPSSPPTTESAARCAYEPGRRQTTGPPSRTTPRCSERNRRRSQPLFERHFAVKAAFWSPLFPKAPCKGRSSELCPVCRFRPVPASRPEPGLRIKRFGRALGDPS